MDDLASRLGELLNSPEGMEKIKNLASMFSGASEKSDTPPAPQQQPEPSASPVSSSGGPALDPDAMRMMMKVAPLLSRFRQEDNSTRLLNALRPFLSDPRQKKLDEAIRMLQLLRMIPMLKSSGIF